MMSMVCVSVAALFVCNVSMPVCVYAEIGLCSVCVTTSFTCSLTYCSALLAFPFFSLFVARMKNKTNTQAWEAV